MLVQLELVQLVLLVLVQLELVQLALVLDELRSAGNLITILSSVAGWTNGHRQIYLSYGEDGQSRMNSAMTIIEA